MSFDAGNNNNNNIILYEKRSRDHNIITFYTRRRKIDLYLPGAHNTLIITIINTA